MWRTLLRFIPGDLRNSIAGDLEEEWTPIRRRYGKAAADIWLTGVVLKLSVQFQFAQVAQGRPLPPIRDELRRKPHMLDSLKQDTVFGIRMLTRQRAFTAVAILALTLGIGANTAIFSVADAVLWRPLPYSDPDHIMQIAEQRPKEGRPFGPVAPADYFDWRHDSRTFESMAAYTGGVANLTGDGEPERVRSLNVSPAFLRVLGVRPIYGRDFESDEEIFGHHRVAILTDTFWRRRFGGDPTIVGHGIQLNGNSYQVVGVLPRSFWWQAPIDMITPLALQEEDRALRGAHFLSVFGRLRPDVTTSQAKDELNKIGQRLAEAFPAENTGHGPNMRSFREVLVGDVRSGLVMLAGSVAFVLLIACTNVATLLMARATARQRELALRRAVGASWSRLVQQMLTESLLLALLSAAAGIATGFWTLRALHDLLPSQIANLPGMATIGIDWRVLLVVLAVSALISLIFGIGPALTVSGTGTGASLVDGTRASIGGRRNSHVRLALVVSQVALSLTLLVGTGLLIASFRNVLTVSPGFRSNDLVAAEISLPYKRYPDQGRAADFFESLYARLRAIPSIDGIAATAALPFTGEDSRLNLDVENRSIESSMPVRAHPRFVSTDYMRVIGIPILRGRPFSDRDNETSPAVVIINDAAARQYWPGENPIGQRISLGTPAHWMEIVGVAGSIHHDSLETEPVPEAYIPQRQRFRAIGDLLGLNMTVLIHTSADLQSAASYVKAVVREIDPQQPVGSVRLMNAIIDESVAPRRLNLILMSAFAFLAVALTAVGLYGVMSYLVVQRTREIGVRVALGATRAQVLGMILRQAGLMTVAGIVIGSGASILLTKWMTTMLFGVSRTSLPIYLGVSFLLAVVALIAATVPSWRATRVDPLTALRIS